MMRKVLKRVPGLSCSILVLAIGNSCKVKSNELAARPVSFAPREDVRTLHSVSAFRIHTCSYWHGVVITLMDMCELHISCRLIIVCDSFSRDACHSPLSIATGGTGFGSASIARVVYAQSVC